MKLVVFGLSMSSSWGNGHATLWRGLSRALHERGHHVTFFERDVPYYAIHRDLVDPPYARLVLYHDWDDIRASAQAELRSADVAIVTSFCFDAIDASEIVLESAALHVFYDLDTPVTLSRLSTDRTVPYVGPRGLRDFDLTLSYTGGPALHELRSRLGARQVAALYGHVDPVVHRPGVAQDQFRGDLSYIGTYAADRQETLERLFVLPAQRLPDRRFVIAGAQYPEVFPWTHNIFFVQHLAPDAHAAFYASSQLTLNVTRRPMAEMGFCPSGRLFEAAACGAPLISDYWDGLEEFFAPGEEIIVARDCDDVINALHLSRDGLRRIAAAAQERVLAQHTASSRVLELERILDDCRQRSSAASEPGVAV